MLLADCTATGPFGGMVGETHCSVVMYLCTKCKEYNTVVVLRAKPGNLFG